VGVDVSICVATCERPHGLARLLESLSRLKIPTGVQVEVVLVDNGPDSDPEARPPEVRGLPLRRFHEARRNVAHARNRCVAEARGCWLAFVDDDEAAHEDWLEAYWSMLDAWDDEAFFGPVLPRAEREGEHWLDLGTFFSRPRHPTGALLDGGSARTGNAFVRRALLQPTGFDPRFGGGGEDAECFRRLRARGVRLRWCDDARVDEFVPPERRTFRWLARRAFGGAYAWACIEGGGLSSAGRAAHGVQAAAAMLAFGAFTPLALCAGRRRAARVALRVFVQAGKLWAWLGGRHRGFVG
jgi:succinoglycan biosynthesis protein ExoM